MTQPRVSRLIASLESEVGAALAERTSRRVVLTPLGSRLRDELVPAYSQLNVALSNARAAARSPGPLRLGFTATTAGPPLDRLIMAFERARPDCTLSLKEAALADSYTPLRTGEIDVLVCWLVLDEPGLTPGPAIASTGGCWPLPTIISWPARRAYRSRCSPTTRCRTGSSAGWPSGCERRWCRRVPHPGGRCWCTRRRYVP